MTIVKLKGAWRLCCGYEYQPDGGGPEDSTEWKPVIEGTIASCRSRFAADNSERC